MSPTQLILIVAAIAAVAYFGGKFLFKKDTKIEDRRRAAAQLAGTLKNLGLKKIPDLLIDYSVGDYSGIADHVVETARVFLDGEEAVVKEFSEIFDRVLSAKLKTEEGRAVIAAKLREAETKPPAKK
jgi:hypothetical protein